MADTFPPKFNRRSVLTAAAVAMAAPATPASAEDKSRPAPPASSPPSAAALAPETTPPSGPDYFVERPGSDFMVDVIKSAGIDYIAAMPGSSFRGLHESIVNYGHNEKPELLTCLHEEISVAMAHGYAKAAGKPMAAMVHGTVGLQHATMAIYNAWCDRVPVMIIAGNTVDAAMRRPGVEWSHSVQDAAAVVRDYVKWDDLPASLQHFSDSFARAYKIATTPPMGPVLLTADSELQERTSEGSPKVQRISRTSPPMGEIGAVMEAAKWLAAAERPVVIVDRTARTPEGVARLVRFAELLGAPVIDKFGRMNMPSRHELNQTDRARELLAEADVVIGLEVNDLFGALNQLRDVVHRDVVPIAAERAKLISISAGDLFIHANYQDFQRYQPVDLAIAGDAEATLPSLTEALERLLDASARTRIDTRRERLRKAFAGVRDRAKAAAAVAWDASPISTARLCAELWALVREEDWTLVSDPLFQNFWPQRLWSIEHHHQYLGNPGGYGVGYGLPAAVGAALAARERGRIAINIQGDGDLMSVPGALWTAAHHKIPLLTVVHNNRAYHQEIMHVQRVANRRRRGIDRCAIGTTFEDPLINYAQIAQSMGVWSEGPIEDPAALGPALQRALRVVKAGEPALLDVISQPR
jgi:acetolactate synthase-1/2/3 large subunit